MDVFAHNPDENPHWTVLVGRRRYACTICGNEKEITTNHTGTVWAERCTGSCRTILNPHTAREVVMPATTAHRYLCEVEA